MGEKSDRGLYRRRGAPPLVDSLCGPERTDHPGNHGHERQEAGSGDPGQEEGARGQEPSHGSEEGSEDNPFLSFAVSAGNWRAV